MTSTGWISRKKAAAKSYDLVADGGGRANCYIVRNGGYFKFAADYPDRNKTYELTGVTGADWLWSTATSRWSPIWDTARKTSISPVRPGTEECRDRPPGTMRAISSGAGISG